MDAIDRAAAAKRGSPFLNTKQAAAFLGVTQRHMERLRARGEGPPFRRHHFAYQYHIDELSSWSEQTGKAFKA